MLLLRYEFILSVALWVLMVQYSWTLLSSSAAIAYPWERYHDAEEAVAQVCSSPSVINSRWRLIDGRWGLLLQPQMSSPEYPRSPAIFPKL